MISKIALENFKFLWEIFDQNWDLLGGTVFKVHPFKQFFPIEFARSFTKESAKSNIHQQLNQWGKFSQENVLFEDDRSEYTGLEIPDDKKFRQRHRMEPEFADMWWLIVRAHFNLRCLVYHRMTIEEKIMIACHKFVDFKSTKESKQALYDLLRISKSFLLAEWSYDLIHKAISNDDQAFFKKLSRALACDEVPAKRSGTAKLWFAVTLLWYLGGRDLTPIREFMNLLNRYRIIPKQMDEHNFTSMLSKLGLTKKLKTEN